nr:hypothetical protein [Streptomyces sp. 3213.3]
MARRCVAADSTPVECARSRDAVMRSDLTGWAQSRLLAERPGQTLIGDKNYFGADFRAHLAQTGAVLLRPARKGEPDPAASPLFEQIRRSASRPPPLTPRSAGGCRRS